MIDPRFAILGALIVLTGNAAYARDTVRGETQPNRVSWMLWALAPMIAFAAQVAQGVGDPAEHSRRLPRRRPDDPQGLPLSPH